MKSKIYDLIWIFLSGFLQKTNIQIMIIGYFYLLNWETAARISFYFW